MSTPDSLHAAIAKRFNLAELDSLCERLGTTVEEIKGETLSAKALELVRYCSRKGVVEKLVEALQQERPKFDWSRYQIPENRGDGQGLRIFFEHVAFYESARLVFVNVSDAPITITTVHILTNQGQVPQNAMFKSGGPDGAGTLPLWIAAGQIGMLNLSDVVAQIWFYDRAPISLTVYDALGREYRDFGERIFNAKFGGYSPLYNPRDGKPPIKGQHQL